MSRMSLGGDRIDGAPGGPFGGNSPQSPRSTSNSSSTLIDVSPFKSTSSSTLSPEFLLNKAPSELPQGVDPNRREVSTEQSH